MFLGAATQAFAQVEGSVRPKPLPPLSNPGSPRLAAKELFARSLTPTSGPAKVIGFYAKGCLSGARRLPLEGDAWQVMRPSRNRYWGDPFLLSFLENTARRAKAAGIWPGFLVGDIAQPRGGPMLAMHVSHQVGLEADIWFRPMPQRKLSLRDREHMMSTVLVRKDRLDVDPRTWRPADLNILRFVAKQAQVLRIFVNPAIKKAICRETSGPRPWLGKIRPEYGHISHFHVRLVCPPGQTLCRNQFPPPKTAGCGKTLAWWFRPQVLHPKPNPHYRPRPPITLAQLPALCRRVLDAK